MTFNTRAALMSLAAAVAVLSVLPACSHRSDSPTQMSEWINPGAPNWPAEMDKDWFLRGDEDASSITSVAQVARAARFTFRARGVDARGTSATSSVLVQPKHLTLGKASFDGYSIKYGDHVQLIVSPADAPVDMSSRLQTADTTTTGEETRLWVATTVNGFTGAYRKPVVQKWASGAVNAMPGVLEWSEPGTGTVPWVRYALVADRQLPGLQALASTLVPAESAP